MKICKGFMIFLYDIMSSQTTIEKLTQTEVIEDFQEILLSF